MLSGYGGIIGVTMACMACIIEGIHVSDTVEVKSRRRLLLLPVPQTRRLRGKSQGEFGW